MSLAIVLLSGGLDSYTAAAMIKAEGFRVCGLTVHYGQRHAQEIESARLVARALGVDRHLELALDLRDHRERQGDELRHIDRFGMRLVHAGHYKKGAGQFELRAAGGYRESVSPSQPGGETPSGPPQSLP